MRVECFLDADILVYAVSSAPGEAAKKRKALHLVQHAEFGLSAHVLEEFYVTVTERIRKPLAPEVAVALLAEYRAFPVVATDYPLVMTAIELSLMHGFSFRDGAVVAAALALEAPVLYSARAALPQGRQFGGVRVVNPFEGA